MAQHLHILGICGTFMGGIALLARELGFHVTGSDSGVYPPMSTQLEAAGITLYEGYSPEQLAPVPDLVIVGNALSRGNPVVEALLNRSIPYTSGPQWLGEVVLRDRWVLAVAGTHGKTTTSSLLAWILEHAGFQPGFLIGGVPGNFGVSARLGASDFFVVEADEYDTAFFDKRSKFLHYRPRTLIAANLEYDHADIFPDLAAIERQFHHLIRCVPGEGLILRGPGDALDRVMAQGVWTPVQRVGHADTDDWQWRPESADCRQLTLRGPGLDPVSTTWSLLGAHNAANATMSVAAARHVGIEPRVAAAGLTTFRGVKRRLEWRGAPDGVDVFDDFAHHPTAIKTTLEGLRASAGEGRLIVAIEPRSNTMRGGVHRDALGAATTAADHVVWYAGHGLDWSPAELVDDPRRTEVANDRAQLVSQLLASAQPGDRVVLMSNGSFDGVHDALLEALERRALSRESH